MSTVHEIICIQCPVACRVKLSVTDAGVIEEVAGYQCKEGKKYAPQEFGESEWTYEITDKIIEQGANQWLETVHKKFQGQIDFRQIEEKYKENMQNLPREQVKGAFGALLIWVVPLGVVYLLGLLVAWIIAGFSGS